MNRVAPLIALTLAGCVSLDPQYVRPDPAIPASWPVGDPYLRQSEAILPALTYQDIFRDPRLQTLIEQSLANNSDLQVAAANIVAAREQYHIQRAQRLPEVDASTGVNAVGNDNGSGVVAQYTAGVGIPSFEVDLFGRIGSLTRADLNRYLATEAGARATRLTLIGDVAIAWLNYAADRSMLQISEQTAASAEKSVWLTRARLEGGIAPRTDLRQAEQILNQARADLANLRTQVAQDVNLLQLLVGAPIEARLLPGSIDEAGTAIGELPAGLSSEVLLRRPDIMQAEYQLLAANAEIGAARAALFPRISLTGLLGLASGSLSGLFNGGSFGWGGADDATYPIFRAGAGRANVRLTQAQRDAAVASYQKAIQTAFREVADALARRATMNDQVRARQAQKEAAADNYMLSEARYREGIDDFLSSLDAQRSSYFAQQTLVTSKLAAATNLVELYRALGGDSLYGSSDSNKQ
ncbi:efflux transporter outer membrane subunit [Sphingomonas sp. G124]|uniref:Efflux transporter outer membrane subunit n=1 Tax=Sphingomonas cremea TaxID=2904799 RepID=A0A9X1QLH0_9SPHN|nr:efflux transporter outer membrane subunit [Sphingomonas cremea]MCF2513559.1 efflux transporter outer membrane subunit [Sphingomonas cremea]